MKAWFYKLDFAVNEDNNTYYSTIQMKLADVKSSTYVEFNAENNDKHHKFEVGNHVKISKYNRVFCKRLSSKLV